MASQFTVAFRADASLLIGNGHIARCLALAREMAARGARIVFITRDHAGHLGSVIDAQGYETILLSNGESGASPCLPEAAADLGYAAFLACSWERDAEQSQAVLAELQPDWLVVDHYALDARWEATVRPFCKCVMVIDDLANRPHVCDLLLDQNLGRKDADYASLVAPSCTLLTGPMYALLRPEFAALRSHSLKRRENWQLENIIVTMGGVDQPNATAKVLEGLRLAELPRLARITVVMGRHAPWLEDIRSIAASMPFETRVLIDIHDMAEHMANSDLAIGAAGGTSWERCCLGLPALIAILADNQVPGATALQERGAALLLGEVGSITANLPAAIRTMSQKENLSRMSHAARDVTNGCGVNEILKNLGSE